MTVSEGVYTVWKFSVRTSSVDPCLRKNRFTSTSKPAYPSLG